ncbi:MAG TPA: SRPBCC domain-containing protein [Bryobacteraceae bacterium]|nr:SRPBCC domain-containing protein [Bryobacteraceae bacterium]
MEPLTYSLDRTIFIQAAPETVFRYFTDSARWARWWGAGSEIDARPGGPMKIRFPNGIEIAGDVLAVEQPRRIVFTYGYTSGNPIGPGGSRVTIELEPEARGTQLKLRHEFSDAATRDQHVQGWRFQLSLFSNTVADEVNAGAPRIIDAWFASWSVEDQDARFQALAGIAVEDIRFRDRYSAITGREELSAHIGAAQRFMTKMRMERRGDLRHCQGIVLADWAAVAPDGQERASGTNVFALGPGGLIESVTGFWNAATGKTA